MLRKGDRWPQTLQVVRHGESSGNVARDAAEAGGLATMPVAVTCAKGGVTPRVQRPLAPRRSDVRDAVLTINF